MLHFHWFVSEMFQLLRKTKRVKHSLKIGPRRGKKKKKQAELCLKKTLPKLWWKLKMAWTQVLPRNVNKRFSKRFLFSKSYVKDLRNLQDVLVCYMFSSAHHGAKEGLQTYTFWNVWEAFRDYDKQEQGARCETGWNGKCNNGLLCEPTNWK